MPSQATEVGPTELPLTAADAVYRDPIAYGLGQYVAHWIRESLTPRTGAQRGAPNTAPIADACPVDHVFPWDHADTYTHEHNIAGVQGVPLPGLWCWREADEWNREHSFLTSNAYKLTYRVDYIFRELQVPDGINARSGLFAAASDAGKSAMDEGYHPTFGWNGDAAGTILELSLGLEHMEYGGSQLVRLGSRPATSPQQSDSGFRKRFFPCVSFVFHLYVRGRGFQQAAGDVQTDALFRFTVDGLSVLERALPPAPDTYP